jgi:hypothetical protein
VKVESHVSIDGFVFKQQTGSLKLVNLSSHTPLYFFEVFSGTPRISGRAEAAEPIGTQA